MKQLIEGVGFSERPHFDCTEQALEVTLRYDGHKLEDLLFDDWRFVYVRLEGEATCGDQVAPGPPLDRTRKFAACGGRLAFRWSRNPAEARARIRQLVDEGRPVPVWVDPYYLPYYVRRGVRGRHSVHAVVVTGYDTGKDTVHVVDPSPRQMFSGEIPAADLSQAMNSDHHQRQEERNAWVEVELPDRRLGRDEGSLRATLRTNLDEMVPGGEGAVKANGRGKVYACHGLRGIRAFADAVERWDDMVHDTMLMQMQTARQQLRVVRERRYGHACFLASAADEFDHTELRQLAEGVEKLAEAWLLPGNMLYKGSLKDAAAMLPRVAGKLRGLAEQEESLLERLGKEVETCCT